MSDGGYIYIITNPAHKNWVKVGITEDIKSRLRSYQTSDPNRNYKVEHYIWHPNYKKAEKDIKNMMHYFAKRIRNEWFEVDLSVAKCRLDETLEES
jgi:hypothetical protein